MKLLRLACHCVSIVTLSLVSASCALAQSQPTEQNDVSAGTHQQPKADPRGTDAAPVVVKVQPPAKTDAETAEDQRKKAQETADRNWTRGLAVVTSCLGLLQVFAIGFQVRIASRQNRLFEKQNVIIGEQTVIAWAHKRIGDDSLRAQKQIERAYITLLDRPKGTHLLVKEHTGTLEGISTHIKIKNFGRTPGFVVGGFCGWIRQGNDVAVDLAKVHSGSRFNAWPVLMPGQAVDYWLLYPSDSTFMDAMVAKTATESIWLVGEIDYRDAFGNYHRSGYGRIYSASAERFVQDPSTNSLNYDRPLTDAEIEQRGYQNQNTKGDSAYL